MPSYKWEGVDKNGIKQKGTLFVDSLKEAKLELKRSQIRISKLKEPGIFETDLSEFMVARGFAKPFNNKDLINFTKKFSILVNSGIPLLEGLEILAKNEKNITLKKSIKAIHSEVASGKTLFEALSRQNGFSKFYCNLVKAGESAGILDGILLRINTSLEKQDNIGKKVKSAMTYPIIVLAVAIGVVILLLQFVVPQIVENFKDSGQELPWPTKVIMGLSDFIGEYIFILILLIVIFIIGLNIFKKSPVTKPLWDQLMLKVPIFNLIVIKSNLASFSRTLATLLSAGVPMIDSMDISIDTINNLVINQDMSRVKYAVVEGKSMSQPLLRVSYFPEMVAQMVKIGEATGKLDEMLYKVADYFETELEEQIDMATKLIEPIMIVVLGGVIAFILIGMYLPIITQAQGI